jgi:PAS domain-containing protein
VQAAQTTLVSPACADVLGREPATLLGPFSGWLERILPEDRELVTAALAQLCLQRQPVTCEYRVVRSNHLDVPSGRETKSAAAAGGELFAPLLPPAASAPQIRWIRDTLAPHYSQDGHLDGWEGVAEDITEQRLLAHDLRHASAVLHAIVTHLPTGIYVVRAPLGQPILVNNRARQLLGQREDLAAGLEHLSTVYRLHRPDGSRYPWEELPVTKALRYGATTMAEDIVVYRADGRRISLVSWAAPVDLGGPGQPAAAIWVLEDRSTLRVVE